jgi:alpha-muurolene/germacrene-A/gamma-muurolene/(+)-delta-cadinol synthase
VSLWLGRERDSLHIIHSFWTRFISKAGPGVQIRFANSLELYLVSINQQAKERSSQENISVENYVRSRQLSSGCKPFFDLLEYSLDMDFPDYVMENPILEAMKDCANDCIGWSNVGVDSTVHWQKLT